MLNINPRDKCYFDVSFNAIKAIGCNLDGSYFKECLAEYDMKQYIQLEKLVERIYQY